MLSFKTHVATPFTLPPPAFPAFRCSDDGMACIDQATCENRCCSHTSVRDEAGRYYCSCE